MYVIKLLCASKAGGQFKFHNNLSDILAYTLLKSLTVVLTMPTFFASSKPKAHLNLLATQI